MRDAGLCESAADACANYQNECHALRDLEEPNWEVIMRKIILAFLGVALIAGATTGAAYSKERHHVRVAAVYHPALPQLLWWLFVLAGQYTRTRNGRARACGSVYLGRADS